MLNCPLVENELIEVGFYNFCVCMKDIPDRCFFFQSVEKIATKKMSELNFLIDLNCIYLDLNSILNCFAHERGLESRGWNLPFRM